MNRFGWFLAGIGLGTLGGVLYAPKAGNETRDDLLRSANSAKDKSTAYAKQAAAGTQEFIQRGKDAAAERIAPGRAVADDHLTKASAALDAGKKAYQEAAGKNASPETPSGPVNAAPERGV